jgi:hypothetical protein
VIDLIRRKKDKINLTSFFTVANIFFLSLNLGFAYFNYSLSRQAYDISADVMGLQKKLYDFNATITVNPNPVLFGSPTGWTSSSGIIVETNYNGYLEGILQVITPHYGEVEITLSDFQVEPSEYIDVQQGNKSSISFGYINEKYDYLVDQGINTFNIKIPLTAKVYPAYPYTLSTQSSVTFILGYYTVQAKLTDLQSQSLAGIVNSTERVYVSLPPSG